MAGQARRWVRVRPLTPQGKAEFADRCERLIRDVLKPRYAPGLRAGGSNSPVDILGRMRASRYTFLARFRSAEGGDAEETFDIPFARIDHLEESLDAMAFDVMWPRHTGQFWPLHRSVPLDDALGFVETEPLLRPLF